MHCSPRDVQTTLNYLQPQEETPYYYASQEPPAGVPAYNASNDSHPVVVHDARGSEDAFKLDVSGFQWVNYPSTEKEFVDEGRIKSVYYAEVEDVLKRHVGAKRVFIYNHAVRRGSSPQAVAARLARTVRGPTVSLIGRLRTSLLGLMHPLGKHFVHADHTFDFAERKVRECLGDDAERLLKGRYQIINVWRPIANPVAHYPLGVVDFRTVDVDADLIPVRLIFPKRESRMYNLKYNPGHKWYYLSDQTPEEVVLIKLFDSDVLKARLAPHSAFPDMTSPVDAPHRQSIEVRALVFDRE